MMAIYTIHDGDLDPVIAVRFAAEENEGVLIEQESDVVDHKESLRILGQAMRSRIEEQTPMRRASIPIPIPAPAPEAQLARTSPRKASPPDAHKPSPPRTLGTIPDDEEPPPTWLAPLISTTSSSRDSILARDKRALTVKKASSAPDLHGRKRPPLQTALSTSAVPVLWSRDSGLNVDKMRLTRAKRNGVLRGAFGAVREVFGGKERVR
jgi:hypothetical protein